MKFLIKKGYLKGEQEQEKKAEFLLETSINYQSSN